jgi:RNA recognition motif-containing protein
MTKLFIGGFPLDITELELVQLVSPYGTVNTIKIVRDKKSGKCKGYAFLEMKDQTDAESVIDALDGSPMRDKVLTINITEDKPAPKFPPSRNNYNRPKTNFTRPVRSDEPSRPKRPRKQG